MLLIIVTSSVFVSIKPIRAERSLLDSAEILSINTVEEVSISNNGIARLTVQKTVDSSSLADIYRRSLAAPSDTNLDQAIPIPENRTDNIQVGQNTTEIVLPVRSEFYQEVEREQLSSFGFVTAICNSSMVPKTQTNAFVFSASGVASPQILNVTSFGSTNKWEILIGPKDENAVGIAVGSALTQIALTQSMPYLFRRRTSIRVLLEYKHNASRWGHAS
jgi:hypothetical protein